jgi:hypothetical protein
MSPNIIHFHRSFFELHHFDHDKKAAINMIVTNQKNKFLETQLKFWLLYSLNRGFDNVKLLLWILRKTHL